MSRRIPNMRARAAVHNASRSTWHSLRRSRCRRRAVMTSRTMSSAWSLRFSPSRMRRYRRVDDLAPLVHHLVVFEDVLATSSAARPGSGRSDGPGDHLWLRSARRRAGSAWSTRFQGRAIEAACIKARHPATNSATSSLAAGPATQLAVDPPRLVAPGAQHVQAAGPLLFGLCSASLTMGSSRQAARTPGVPLIQAAFAQR